MLKRYRYRAYPTPRQRQNVRRLFGCVRTVYNDALMSREQAYKDGRTAPDRRELSAALTRSKLTPEREWLTEVSSVPLQQALDDLGRAYRNFFDSMKGKRRGQKVQAPRLRKRSSRQSARFTRNAGFRVRETSHGLGFLTLPKIGRIRYNSSRALPSEPSSVTLVQERDGRYYVSFVVDEPAVPNCPLEMERPTAGVDLGLADLATIARTDGSRDKIENPRWMHTKEHRLARAQRALSRKKKGSANWAKARLRVARQHQKIRETRLDHHHKLALHLVRENQTVAVENLAIVGLARTQLAKSIHDAGWAILVRLLEEKAPQHGSRVVTAGRWAPTTQTCAVCGVPGGKKALHIRTWQCQGCSSTLDRDYNAAVNIMVAAGLAETLNACGGSVRRQLAVADPVKQEPTEQALYRKAGMRRNHPNSWR